MFFSWDPPSNSPTSPGVGNLGSSLPALRRSALAAENNGAAKKNGRDFSNQAVSYLFCNMDSEY